MSPKRSEASKYLERNALTALPSEINLDRSGICLSVLEAHYKRTKNPLYAWHAIQKSRELDLELPKWVLAYLQQSADRLLDIQGDLGDKTQQATTESLCLKTVGGGSVFTRFRTELRNVEICLRVQDLREQRPARKDIRIYNDVGRLFCLEHAAVRSIVKKYSNILKIDND